MVFSKEEPKSLRIRFERQETDRKVLDGDIGKESNNHWIIPGYEIF